MSGFRLLLTLQACCAIGCTTIAQTPGRVAQRATDFVECINQNILAHRHIRVTEREALKDELQADREAELACHLAEINAERDAVRQDQLYRAEALRAETERRREAMRQNFDESVRTRVGLDMEQRVRLGQLQVDMDKLKKVIDEREQDYQHRLRLYDEAQRQAEMESRLAALQAMQAQRATGAPLVAGAPLTAPCGAAQRPLNDCAIPPALPQRPAPAPVRQPLLPTEVPFMLPVTLEVGLESGGIRQSEVRHMPLKPPCLPGAPQRPVDCCPQAPCGRYGDVPSGAAGAFGPKPTPVPPIPDNPPGDQSAF